jgi:hypothetical protein
MGVMASYSTVIRIYLKSLAVLIACAAFLPLPNAKAQTLQQPAAGYYKQFSTEGALGIGVFNGKLILAYSNHSNNYLGVGTSPDGVNFTGPSIVSQATVSPAPSVVSYNGLLYIFYRDSVDSTIKQVSSSDGVNFSNPTQLLTASTGSAIYTSTSVSVVADGYFPGLYIAYVDAYGNVQGVTATPSTIEDSTTTRISQSYTTSAPPSLVLNNGYLVVGYQASNHILVMNQTPASSPVWGNEYPYSTILMGTGPNVTTYDDNLVVTFQSNDKYHDTVQTTGSTFNSLVSPAPTFYDNINTGSALACYQDLSATGGYTYFCALQSNDQYHITFLARGN